MTDRDEVVTYLRGRGVDNLVFVLIPNDQAGVVRLAMGTKVEELKAVAKLLKDHPDVERVFVPRAGEPVIQFSLTQFSLDDDGSNS